MIKSFDVENLAVSFTVSPCSPNNHHCEVWELIALIGGGIAINYGIYLAIPKSHRQRKAMAGRKLGESLRQYAKTLNQ